MKLLIDIPEHVYEHAKEMTEDSRDEGEAMRAIAKGSPARCKGVDEAEKERLIKKNMLSIENRVRHVFNQGYEMGVKKNKSEIPTSCGDAISRQRAIFLASDLKQDLPDDERIADMVMAHNEGILDYQTRLSLLPSVSPQQRTGRWIKQNYGWNWQCSECGFVTPPSAKEIFTFCPNCGAKMEVEDI